MQTGTDTISDAAISAGHDVLASEMKVLTRPGGASVGQDRRE